MERHTHAGAEADHAAGILWYVGFKHGQGQHSYNMLFFIYIVAYVKTSQKSGL